MKAIDEAFSARGFRRVVLPGIVVTIGIHPPLEAALGDVMSAYGLSESSVILVVEIVVYGLILSSATDWVYFVYEGFAFPWVTRLARRWNEWRLAKQTARVAAIQGWRRYDELSFAEQDRVAMIHQYLRDFPLRRDRAGRPERFVERPTRLGNIIATYELYPGTRYGIDGVFFWFHVLACSPESSRQDFEDEYAFAESLVVTSFAGLVIAVVNVFIQAGLVIGSRCSACALVSIPPGAVHPVASLVLGLAVFVLFYRLALPVHREAGRMFRTLVDLGMEKFVAWVNQTSAPLDDSSVKKARALRDHLDGLVARTEAPGT